VRPQRKRNTLARTAAKGLGAAAVAIPLGFWLGRRSRSHTSQGTLQSAD
jgi:hypothetical protein